MKRKMSLRAFVEKNKSIFDIIGSIGIGVMSIIVSMVATRIGFQANELSSQANTLMENQIKYDELAYNIELQNYSKEALPLINVSFNEQSESAAASYKIKLLSGSLNNFESPSLIAVPAVKVRLVADNEEESAWEYNDFALTLFLNEYYPKDVFFDASFSQFTLMPQSYYLSDSFFSQLEENFFKAQYLFNLRDDIDAIDERKIEISFEIHFCIDYAVPQYLFPSGGWKRDSDGFLYANDIPERIQVKDYYLYSASQNSELGVLNRLRYPYPIDYSFGHEGRPYYIAVTYPEENNRNVISAKPEEYHGSSQNWQYSVNENTKEAELIQFIVELMLKYSHALG